MTTSKRLSQVAKTAIVLPFLLAALLGFSFHSNAAIHATTSVSAHHATADVDVNPPSD